MAILLNNHGYDNATWLQALAELLPEQKVFLLDEMNAQRREEVEYALVWNHPRGDLATYPNLKGVMLLGAGTEALDADPDLPDVPIVRLVDPEVLADMARYALYWVIHYHRRFADYARQQQRAEWQRHDLCASQDFSVLVMGQGMVGRKVAELLHTCGYKVSGWDRSPQQSEIITCYADAELPAALAQADMLVNCLPANEQTRNMIDREVLAMLPDHAVLVNVSRGDVVNDTDLLAALDNDDLAAAVLDAFSVEPLPRKSPFWGHDRVHVTPHMSGATYARSAAKLVVANMQRIEQGEPAFPLYKRPCE